MSESPATTRHFFVDEAGDLSLFDKKGRVIVGDEGVSNYFMVGVAELPNPERAAGLLNSLRVKLVADPYFKGVPSMSVEEGKTALFFHAKDDVAEVRREVFQLLPTLGASVHVAVRRKNHLVHEARFAHKLTGKRLEDSVIYDDLIKRLFKNLLHKADENQIVFARRGKTDRFKALEAAIGRAKKNFENRWKKGIDRPTHIHSATPSQVAGLQVIDYYLWALQRMFERGEDRYFLLLAKNFRFIMDLDDTRNKDYGEWYSDSNPLSLEKIRPLKS